MAADVLAALRDGLPANCLVTDADLMESYRYDRAMFSAAGRPIAVVLAREIQHVQHVVRVATRFGVPVVAQGARSGLSGAANAVDGCIVLSLERMNRILEIDVANRVAVVEPGVFNADLSRTVEEHGLFYPPDPSSWEFCTIGGNVATNAGGLCCVKYGVTADYVLGLEVVLADGEVLRTGRRTVKGVAGYDLTQLFVGSEGTLGVITQVTVAVRPLAQRPHTMAAIFPSVVAAGSAVAQIVAAGVVPSLLEIMDGTSIRAVNAWRDFGLPDDAAALLVAQSDLGGTAAVAEIAAMVTACREAGATEVVETDDPKEGELLLAARRSVILALDEMGTTMIDDVCVPQSSLVDLIGGVEKIAKSYDLTIAVVGHAGDGNMHPTVVFDQADADQASRAQAAFDEIMRLGLDLGGTITGEHGVGLLKRDWLARELGPVSLRVHQDLKRTLDPQGILNPGKVLRAPTG